MIRIGIILITICILSYSCCEKSNYIKGIQKDSQQIFDRKKEFFTSFTFSGVIDKKKYCENCNMNKYQIIITLDTIESDSVELKNQYYQPYYFFDKPNQLNLSVTKILYESISEMDIVKKEGHSDYLVLSNKKYRLLSEKKNEWLSDK